MTHVALGDPQRVAGIRALEILGTPPRTDLIAVADLAARVCGVPMATISLLTDVEQHQIAAVGMPASVCAVEDSMCASTLEEEGTVVVPDTRVDPRFRDNPFVTGELGSFRFYASHRLVTRDGLAIGTLCVFDHEVRHLDEDQREALTTLSERVVDILELSLRSRELASTLAEVQAVRAALERSNERLSSFAGQVSHDLKTPLTSMSLSLSLIRDELAREPDEVGALPLLDRAISGSSRMAALIDEVLAFAQLGGNLRHDDVDLDAVLEHVRHDLGDRLDGVTLEAGPLPVVVGDEVQLRSVLQNLVDNAAKFADPTRPAEIRLSAHRVPSGWRVEVTDNGRGIPVAQLDRVFEPLVRAHPGVDGHGIGLATCRRIIEAHGGRIGLERVEPVGTKVWFELAG